jgi:rubrerythrin
MRYSYTNKWDDENDDQCQWEWEHDHKIIWKCPVSGYSYESERYVNSALNCPYCGITTEEAGESYQSKSRNSYGKY